MIRPLRVLILEDQVTDTELMLHELRGAGFQPKGTRVDTEKGFLAHLSADVDVILADYSLPQFDAVAALRLAQERHPDIPFIVVSGSINEEVAVSCIKQGAADYLLKDRLTRLGPAVSAALGQRSLRQAKRAADEALRQSENLFRLLAENATDLISRHTLQGVCLYASPACRSLLGYEASELVGHSPTDLIHPDDLAEFEAALAEGLQLPRGCTLAYRIRRNDGEYVWFETTARMLREERSHVAAEVQAISRDITARKRAEEQIAASLREKEVLLREIHHRVKNNLQIITSLLKLQSGYVQDRQARALFKESQHRVNSMALVHETLYRSKDLGKIDMALYIRSLVHHLERCYGLRADEVLISLDVEGVVLGIDTAVPCALLINELVSNAFKHAFPAAQGGEIQIGFHQDTNERFTLTVVDNGVGLPSEIDLGRANTLGLQLVKALTDQLGAKMEVCAKQGTSFKFTFAELKYKERLAS